MQIITLGIGTPGTIAGFVLLGLTPSPAAPLAVAAERTYTVPAENRVYTVPFEDRVYTVPKG